MILEKRNSHSKMFTMGFAKPIDFSPLQANRVSTHNWYESAVLVGLPSFALGSLLVVILIALSIIAILAIQVTKRATLVWVALFVSQIRKSNLQIRTCKESAQSCEHNLFTTKGGGEHGGHICGSTVWDDSATLVDCACI